MNPPDKLELAGNPPYSPDEEHLLEHFLGKTNEEMVSLFSKVPLTEDFSYMQPEGLLYYLYSALHYLQIDESVDDWEFSSGILCSFKCLLEYEIKFSIDLRELILEITEYIEKHLDKFCTDEEDKNHILNYILYIEPAIRKLGFEK